MFEPVLYLAVVAEICIVEFIERFVVAGKEVIEPAVAQNRGDCNEVFKFFIGELGNFLTERFEEQPQIVFEMFEFRKHDFRRASYRNFGLSVALGELDLGEGRTVYPPALLCRRLRGCEHIFARGELFFG